VSGIQVLPPGAAAEAKLAPENTVGIRDCQEPYDLMTFFPKSGLPACPIRPMGRSSSFSQLGSGDSIWETRRDRSLPDPAIPTARFGGEQGPVVEAGVLGELLVVARGGFERLVVVPDVAGELCELGVGHVGEDGEVGVQFAKQSRGASVTVRTYVTRHRRNVQPPLPSAILMR
jgi:hypothetical protein